MGFFNKLRSDGNTFDGQGDERRGLVDVIQYNGAPDELVWKFPYNNLSTGAQLIVNKSQEAIFVKGGAVCDVFGEGTHTISANNLPLLEKIVNLPFGGRTPFTAEVWYVNKVIRRGLKFGTPQPIRVLDPEYNGVDMPVRAHGDYSVRVKDGQMLLNELVGTLHLFTTDDIVGQFSSMVVQELNRSLMRFAHEQRISPLRFPMYAPDIADFIKDILVNKLELYGMEIIDFQFAHVGVNEDDPKVKAVIDARFKAEERRSQGYNYQQERQFDILETAAGNENGTQGNVMGAGIGMGMGVGMGAMFGGQMQQTAQVMGNAQPVSGPPPIVSSPYYVYVNGAQQGPYDSTTLRTLAETHVLTPDTLVWKQGMPQWAKAGDQIDLRQLFATAPPPPPVPPVMP